VQRLLAGDQVAVAGVVLYLERDGPNRPGPKSALVIGLVAAPWWKAGMVEAAQQAFLSRVDEVRADIDRLIAESPEFRSAVGERDRRIEVVDDYGTGTVLRAVATSHGSTEWRG
jgi:hypothetical protein